MFEGPKKEIVPAGEDTPGGFRAKLDRILTARHDDSAAWKEDLKTYIQDANLKRADLTDRGAPEASAMEALVQEAEGYLIAPPTE